MRRWLALIVLGLLIPGEARAFELRPYGKIGVDAGYDDHVSGREAPDPLLFEKGNADASGGLSLGLGNEFVFDDNRVLTLSASLKGYRYLNYPDFSGAWAGLATELATYRLFEEVDAFWGLNAGASMGTGRSAGLSVTFERPTLWNVTGGLSMGGYRYVGSTTSQHLGLWGELSLRRRFGPLGLTAAYNVSQRGYDVGDRDQAQGVTLFATFRVLDGLYLKASAEHTWAGSTDVTRVYEGSFANLGSVYYVF